MSAFSGGSSARESFSVRGGRSGSCMSGKKTNHAPDLTPKPKIDRRQVCPLCNSRVALQDPNRAIILGQCYHLSELRGENQIIKVDKKTSKALKELYQELLTRRNELSDEERMSIFYLEKIF